MIILMDLGLMLMEVETKYEEEPDGDFTAGCVTELRYQQEDMCIEGSGEFGGFPGYLTNDITTFWIWESSYSCV